MRAEKVVNILKPKFQFRYILFRTIASVFGLVIGLLVMETGLRIWLFRMDALNITKVNSFRPIGNSDHIQAADDLRIVYELKPGLDTWFKLKPLRTNSKGLRDKEYTLTKPPNTYRVAVIGDSFTFGDGVAIENVYHSVLENSLNHLSDSLHYEFINFGLGGYNLMSYLGLIEQKVLAYNPDLIVIGFCGNNDDDLPGKNQGKKPFKARKLRWLLHHSQIIRTLNEIVKNKRRASRRAHPIDKPIRVRLVTESFAKFRTASEQHSIPILVFYLTMQDAPPGNNEWIQRLATGHGFGFVDSSPVVDTVENIQDFWVHSTDRHPNSAIHSKYSQLLMEYFVEEHNINLGVISLTLREPVPRRNKGC